MKTDTSLVRIVVRLARAAAGSAFYAAIAFLGAGRLDWLRGWIYAAVFVAVSIIGSMVVQCVNPGLLDARAKGFRTNTKSFDKIFYLLFLPLVLAYPLLAGVDAERFAWAPLPWWTIYPGAFMFLAGSLLTAWTMVVNPHAETTVRIQEQHTVVSTGPYRFVRHPMYAGTVVGLPSGALVLGSGWALVPLALMVALFVWRMSLEDRTLQRELPGYKAYTRSTRYRLIPGLW